MSGLILATEQAIGSHIFRTASFSKPAALWVGLFTTIPANDGTGGVEVVGGGYARVQRNPGDANWGTTISASGSAEFYNAADVLFAVPTADWGMVKAVGLWPTSTGGTPYIVGGLAPTTLDFVDRFWQGVYILAGESAVKFDAQQLRFIVT